ncbi:MAG: DHHA1 domain-containing protein, partial [Lachnospiraceae bacterium]
VKLTRGKIGHVGRVEQGMFANGDTVRLSVDAAKREDTAKNHSATHLLQKALRTVLGSHVEQAGSLVNEEHLRFDFTHFGAMTPEELADVENMVNEQIAQSLPVVTEVMTLDEARKTGAMALFGEKYGEHVRVVKMGDYSMELCGGTHVANTGQIRLFKIVSESGVAAGVRRIEALTGNGVMAYYQQTERALDEACAMIKCSRGDLPDRLRTLMRELKSAQGELESLKNKMASSALGDVMGQVVDVNGVKLLALRAPDVDMNGLRELGDQLKEKLGEGVVALASVLNGKVSLLVMATDGAVKAKAHAGKLVQAMAVCVGGGGGGRPNMAQAGGKNPEGIDAAIAKAKEILAEMTKK